MGDHWGKNKKNDYVTYTVKRLIIDDDLFGEIGKFKKFAKISCRQIITLQSLYIAVLEIAKLILCQIVIYTVKRLIIGDYLFGEIGEFFKFAKISCHHIGTLQSLDITSVGNHQINSLPNCHI